MLLSMMNLHLNPPKSFDTSKGKSPQVREKNVLVNKYYTPREWLSHAYRTHVVCGNLDYTSPLSMNSEWYDESQGLRQGYSSCIIRELIQTLGKCINRIHYGGMHNQWKWHSYSVWGVIKTIDYHDRRLTFYSLNLSSNQSVLPVSTVIACL